jgi:hypothetical protein
MSSIQLLLAATAVFAIYAFLTSRVYSLFQPMRCELADEGEALIADESIPEDIRLDVESVLDRAFSNGAAWLIVVLFPYAAVLALFSGPASQSALDSLPVKVRGKIMAVMRKGLFCVLSNSPLAFLIFVLEVLLLACLYVPVGIGARRAIHFLSGASRNDHNHHATQS